MAHVFISYKHEDGDFAELLKGRLEKEGFETWMDTDIQGGEKWSAAIDQAIENASALVVVMSPEAKKSDYITYEWSFALGLKKTVVPVLLRGTELHPKLAELQYIDFTNRTRLWDQLFQRLRDIGTQTASSNQVTQAATTHMIESLRNPDKAIREYAAKMLGIPGNIIAIELLQKIALHDKEFMVRAMAAEALGKIGDRKAVPTLIQCLRDDTSSIRFRAAEALGEIRDESAISALRKSLFDPEALVRAYAAQALGNLHAAEAVEDIIKTSLGYPNNNVRGRAAKALGDIGEPLATLPLIQHLSDTEIWFAQIRICDVAAQSLARIGTPEALAAVEEWRHKQQNQQ